jgi:hypothetical protein
MRCPLWTTRTARIQRTSTAARWVPGTEVRPSRWTHAPSSGTANCGGRRCTVCVMSVGSLYMRQVSSSFVSVEWSAWISVRVSVIELGWSVREVCAGGRSRSSESECSASAGRDAGGSRAVKRWPRESSARSTSKSPPRSARSSADASCANSVPLRTARDDGST